MPRYLLALSIGPVQEFIAAARRSRDLWFGSYLLSEVSKAAAQALQAQGAQLIFPAPAGPADLQPDSDFNAANKLLLEAETGDPAALAQQAKTAAQNRWSDLAEQTLARLRKTAASRLQVQFHVRQALWDAQVDDVLELYAAWVLLDGDYGAARRRVDALLAARKNSRDFEPAKAIDKAYGVPKSSLDGKRESVLPDETALPKWAKRRLGLNAGEQLDCPGVVKRLGHRPGDDDAARFTSSSRIALDSWLRRLVAAGVDLQPLFAPLEALIGDGLVSRAQGNGGIYGQLPYDGQLLYPARLEAQLQTLQREGQDGQAAAQRLDDLKRAIQAMGLYRQYGEPSPYVAVLLADGDRMGEQLNRLDDPGQHRRVSQALAAFAQAVPDIVRRYFGHCIYCGGDDVLALLPVDQAVACARVLHDAFADALRQPEAATPPTLSVGLAIGHLLEPRGALLDLARQAEKLAKGDHCPEALRRDALGILLEPRSGVRMALRERWDKQPDQRLGMWIRAFQNDEVPDKAAYQLRELARQLDWAPADLLEKEARRILRRKQAEHGQRRMGEEQQEQLLQALRNRCADVADGGRPAQALTALVDEWLIARRLSQAV